jgi:hypothetical protein
MSFRRASRQRWPGKCRRSFRRLLRKRCSRVWARARLTASRLRRAPRHGSRLRRLAAKRIRRSGNCQGSDWRCCRPVVATAYGYGPAGPDCPNDGSGQPDIEGGSETRRDSRSGSFNVCIRPARTNDLRTEEGCCMIRLEPKRPDETRRLGHDWSAFLGTDTIASQTTTSSDVTITGAALNGTQATQFTVSGGTTALSPRSPSRSLLRPAITRPRRSCSRSRSMSF